MTGLEERYTASPCCLWPAQATLGEGPLWDAASRRLYWLDIKRAQLYCLIWPEVELRCWPLSEPVTSLALTAQPDRLLVTCRRGLAWLALSPSPALRSVSQLDQSVLTDEPIGNRFNDGKVDSAGRFWVGTMDDGERHRSGHLYCVQGASLVRADSGYCITNGPTFSPDGKTLYHTSSTDRRIYQFNVDGAGKLGDKRLFYQVPVDRGYPDGLTTDSDGCIWLCHFAGGCVSRLSPAGELLATLSLPVSNVTACAFGGSNLELLFITTARWGLTPGQIAAQPSAGGLFVCRPGATGLPTNTVVDLA